MAIGEVLTRAEEMLTVRRVYGEPFEENGARILPAAAVRGGGGGGSGGGEGSDGSHGQGEGGGFGMSARPVGVFVFKEGRTTWRPAVDFNRIVLGGQAVGIVYFVTRWLSARARAKATIKAARRA